MPYGAANVEGLGEYREGDHVCFAEYIPDSQTGIAVPGIGPGPGNLTAVPS